MLINDIYIPLCNSEHVVEVADLIPCRTLVDHEPDNYRALSLINLVHVSAFSHRPSFSLLQWPIRDMQLFSVF